MTPGTKHAPRRSAILVAATLAVLVLAGCTSGNIGESWQCPLAKGGSCDSVAGADPAVPTADAAGRTVLREPLYRVRPGGRSMAPVETPCDAECGAGFDPFAWLARLFGVDGKAEAKSPEAKSPPAEAVGPAPTLPRKDEPAPAEPAAAGLPDPSESTDDDVSGDDLRTGEVVARIWIAPFVDANGVYREAAHIRVVLEPAGWRLK